MRVGILHKSLILAALCGPLAAQAQSQNLGYDDYETFSSAPTDLDNEVAATFGRFFQMNILLGSGIWIGDLGQAYAAGVLTQLRFVYYFDRIWAAEIGLGYGRHSGYYNEDNTATTGVDLNLNMTLVPIFFGLRYAFDIDNLSRSFATINPYVSINAEVLYKSEAVQGTPTVTGLSAAQQAQFGVGGTATSSAFGVNLGGGFEFDVYNKRVYLGVDLRYHLTYWPADVLGALGRGGNYFVISGMATYNY